MRKPPTGSQTPPQPKSRKLARKPADGAADAALMRETSQRNIGDMADKITRSPRKPAVK